MLLLFETPAGYSLFKVTDTKKIAKTDASDIFEKFFSSETKAQSACELVSFQPFADTADAVQATTAAMEGKVCSSLQKFLKKKVAKTTESVLAIADKTLAGALNTSMDQVSIVHDSKTQELFRGIRCYMDTLLADQISSQDMRAMQLGLSHAMSRYKLKFSADKVDTMVIQAVGLLDELDKEINTYAMRVKEWYGWHFPELQQLVGDNATYSQLVLQVGMRDQYPTTDLSSILTDEHEIAAIQEAAQLSMGTEIADADIINIQALASQVLSMTEYRSQLFDYLQNRMNAIAPNLTILVGELVGARLMAHAGSLLNLAKQPASTVQILGAEKALFRALKTKHDTPKYGLIYHASLVGQAAPKNKGKISRVLAAKAALAIRVDALSDESAPQDTTVGFQGRSKVEARLRQLEGGTVMTSTASAQKTAKYHAVAAKSAAVGTTYQETNDVVMDHVQAEEDDETKEKKKKKHKKEKKRKSQEGDEEEPASKKRKAEDDQEDEAAKKAAKKAKKAAKKEKRKSKEE